MEALAELPGVQVKRFPGTLGLHEEFAAEVTEAGFAFLTHPPTIVSQVSETA